MTGGCFTHITWLVVDLPLWKMMEWVRQLGWWDSQYSESHNPFHGSSHHQPDDLFLEGDTNQISTGGYGEIAYGYIIWANYNNSLTWIKAMNGDDSPY